MIIHPICKNYAQAAEKAETKMFEMELENPGTKVRCVNQVVPPPGLSQIVIGIPPSPNPALDIPGVTDYWIGAEVYLYKA